MVELSAILGTRVCLPLLVGCVLQISFLFVCFLRFRNCVGGFPLEGVVIQCGLDVAIALNIERGFAAVSFYTMLCFLAPCLGHTI